MKYTIKNIMVSCFSHGYTVILESEDNITLSVSIPYAEDLNRTFLEQVKRTIRRKMIEERKLKMRMQKWHDLKKYLGTMISIEGDT